MFQLMKTFDTIINQVYPGGVRYLHDNGCSIGYNYNCSKVYIYNPNKLENLEILRDVIKDSKVPIEVVITEESNVGDLSPVQFAEIVKDILPDLVDIQEVFISLDYSPAYFSLFVNEDYDEDKAKRYASIILENLPVIRGEVYLKGTSYEFDRDTFESSDIGNFSVDKTQRTNPITSDDILNLKIALNQETDVLDIIGSL